MIPPGDEVEPAGEPPPARPGTSTFTIEGRATPALFVIGWLATLMGIGLLFVSVQAASGAPATILLLLALVLLAIGLVTAAGSQGIERRARGKSPYGGPSPILVFAASIPIAALALVLAGIPLSLAGVDLDGPLVALVSVTVQALVYVGLIRLLVVDTRALSWAQMGIRRPGGSVVRELLAGAAWAIPVIILTIPIANILVGLFQVTPDSPLPAAGEPVGIVLNLVAGGLVAPIGEELFFRGFATTAWVQSLGATRGIIRAGLVFAFVHILLIQGSGLGEGAGLALIGFATRVPIGLALGWLFVKRGSIWAPIGLHAAFNSILLLIAELPQPAGGG